MPRAWRQQVGSPPRCPRLVAAFGPGPRIVELARCPECGEEHPQLVSLSAAELYELEGRAERAAFEQRQRLRDAERAAEVARIEATHQAEQARHLRALREAREREDTRERQWERERQSAERRAEAERQAAESSRQSQARRERTAKEERASRWSAELVEARRLLGLPETFTEGDVRAALGRAARVAHPDRGDDAGGTFKRASAAALVCREALDGKRS
jgi:hypothetical protein